MHEVSIDKYVAPVLLTQGRRMWLSSHSKRTC